MNDHLKRSGRMAVTVDRRWLTLDDIAAIAIQGAEVVLSDDPDFRTLISKGADFLDRLLTEEGKIYGVTTGYGDSCTRAVPLALTGELPHRLYTYHGCGLGDFFDIEQTRAIMATRLVSLCKGYSGVNLPLLEQLTRLINSGIHPQIPAEGSVGASGDLTPLSYLAAALCGEREVHYRDAVIPAADALAQAGLNPIRLRPKEALALMNGTAVMTGLAALAFFRAVYLAKLACRITAMASVVIDGRAAHFDETLFSVKPHLGQQQAARWIRNDLGEATGQTGRLQDRYSIRCAPHVIGVLLDAIPWIRTTLENELNSANDNPIIDPIGEQVLHGGHFYGGHVAFAMDSLKNAVANIADLLDRQMAQLVDPRCNQGLPANLSGAAVERAPINHGLKALQISVSAWTAEALKLTMPASVFSRSTECHNQDKVSLGTIAARDCLRIVTLVEQVTAALLIAVRQGLWLRGRLTPSMRLTSALTAMLDALAEDVAVVDEDRRLDTDLRRLVERIRTGAWSLYDD